MMLRFRISIRGMMLTVAALAIALGYFLWQQRTGRLAKYYVLKALCHADGERAYESDDPNHTHAAYHGQLKRKYEHAARYPWLPVDPDPPHPPGMSDCLILNPIPYRY